MLVGHDVHASHDGSAAALRFLRTQPGRLRARVDSRFEQRTTEADQLRAYNRGMQRATTLSLLLAAMLLAVAWLEDASAQGPFPDVPPCHWAADSVARLADPVEPEVRQARGSRYLAANAPRQVLEGLRCGEPEWSLRFLVNAPADWQPRAQVEGFSLRVQELRLQGDRGRAHVRVQLTVDGESTVRSGPIALDFVDGVWKVEYATLAELDLPLLP